jgi:hypothetical protein
MLSVIMLNTIMLNVFMLSVVKLNSFMLNVVAPSQANSFLCCGARGGDWT